MLTSPNLAQGGAIPRVQQLNLHIGCITGHAAGAGAALASSGDSYLTAAGHHTVREAAAHGHRCPHTSREQQHPITNLSCCEPMAPYVAYSADRLLVSRSGQSFCSHPVCWHAGSACRRRLGNQEQLLCCNADLLDSSAEAGDPSKSLVPKEAPRPRGLWGATSQVASSGAGREDAVGESSQQASGAEPDQAACRGTSLVGSGVSMSALSAAFQV